MALQTANRNSKWNQYTATVTATQTLLHATCKQTTKNRDETTRFTRNEVETGSARRKKIKFIIRDVKYFQTLICFGMCVCKSILKPIIQLFFLLTKIQWVMFEQPRRRRRRRFKNFSDKKERRNRNEDKKNPNRKYKS